MAAEILPEVTLGNFIGPAIAALTLYAANYWQAKGSRQKELDQIVSPINEKLGDLTLKNRDFVPKHEIDARFLAIEGRQLTTQMDLKDLQKLAVDMQVKQGQTDEAMRAQKADIMEIKDQQKEMLKLLHDIHSDVRHERKS